MDSSLPDKRALKILFGHYWSPLGWIPHNARTITPEDFDYAKSNGLMFDPIAIGHDDVMRRLLSAVRRTSPRLLADAFVASLSTRRLDWRSALGSFAVFRHAREHEPTSTDGFSCDVCGQYLKNGTQDLNVLNFERFKWGGVRHTSPLYAMLDLELFLESGSPQPGPSDVAMFRDLIRVIEQIPAGITGAALQAKLAGIFKSNKSERDILVSILGYCGVLAIPGFPGFFEKFAPAKQRVLPHHHFVDVPYPACWWRSEYGIDKSRLNDYFGHML
jgi:hypothetical protein